MIIKKILSVVLAVVLCFCASTLFVCAEENTEIPEYNEGLMPTLPPFEEVEISVVYRPLKSMISFADFGPFLDGTVLKVTYSDGTTENVTIEKSENDSSDYVAGKFNIYFNLFNTAEIKSPGINKKTIIIRSYEDGVEYEGKYCDFSYLYIPSPAECFYLLTSLIRIYNPFD